MADHCPEPAWQGQDPYPEPTQFEAFYPVLPDIYPGGWAVEAMAGCTGGSWVAVEGRAGALHGLGAAAVVALQNWKPGRGAAALLVAAAFLLLAAPEPPPPCPVGKYGPLPQLNGTEIRACDWESWTRALPKGLELEAAEVGSSLS